MMYLAALWVVIVPVALLLIPGLPFVVTARSVNKQRDGRLAAETAGGTGIVPQLAMGVLWSVCLGTLLPLLGLGLGVSVPLVTMALWLVAGIQLWRQRQRFWRYESLYYGILLATVLFLLYAGLAIPYLVLHDGLPTGDSQKAMLWAREILSTQQWPDYSQAVSQLNRDPVDFYTPGLHAFMAAAMGLTTLDLQVVGLLTIIVQLSVLLLAVATAYFVFPAQRRLPLTLFTVVLLLANWRWLRYVREPGYHYQNIVGELLLFGVWYICLRLLKRWDWRHVILLSLLVVTLVISHQFSAFLAVFTVLPLAGLFVVRLLGQRAWRQYVRWQTVWPLGLVGIALLAGGVALDLHEKVPHLFTRTPHLLFEVPAASEYTRLLGSMTFWTGVGGLMVVLVTSIRRRHVVQLGLVFATLALLLLSQGPRLGIDIPPVRALFYSAVPFSILAAGLFTRWWALLHASPTGRIVKGAVAVWLMIALVTSLKSIYITPTVVRTDSTLTVAIWDLATTLQAAPERGGVLVDDYNRRASSWLLLSGKPMYTRLAADIAVQMAEAQQSSLRRELYLNQLDYEKIFLLGGQPIIAELLDKHQIQWVTGINSSSERAFTRNTALTASHSRGDITLFHQRENIAPSAFSADINAWLLKPSTLANDIGDDEDTWLHLMAAVRATRLSSPQNNGSLTYRTTTAPVIPLAFNVGDYVVPLWNLERQPWPASAVQVIIALAERPRTPLILTTTSGKTYTLDQAINVIRLEATDIPYNDEGFVVIQLHNPTQQPVAIDLIALGLDSVP